MKHLLRLSLVLVIVSAVSLAVGLLLTAPIFASTHAAPLTIDLTATPTVEFSATLRLSPSRTVVAVGQTLRLTADLSVVEGCSYGIMDLTVHEDADGEPLFAHVDPCLLYTSPSPRD